MITVQVEGLKATCLHNDAIAGVFVVFNDDLFAQGREWFLNNAEEAIREKVTCVHCDAIYGRYLRYPMATCLYRDASGF